MSPQDNPISDGVYPDAYLSGREGSEQIDALQRQVELLQGQVESHTDERRRDWNRVNQWALAANIALFSVAIVVAVGVTTHNFLINREMSEQGERLTIVEERLRQLIHQNSMTRDRD